jgi:5'-nucleotidase
MNRSWLRAGVAAGLLASGCATPGGPNRQIANSPHREISSFTLSLVGTNDLHGGFQEVDGRGGLALLDGYVSNLRAARRTDNGAVMVVDAGDLFSGTLESKLTEGAAVIDAYNAIGYQAAAVGNHEFDYGPIGDAAVPLKPGDDPRGALKARIAQARFPFLAANLIETSTGAPVNWPNTRPSTIVDVGGMKVGIVGALLEDALTQTIAPNVQGLRVSPVAPAVIEQATSLRRQGATIVIALIHSGAECTKFDNPTDLSVCRAAEEIFGVARAAPPGLLDAIVAGHRHWGMAAEVNGVPIIQSYWSGRAFGRIDLTVDRASRRVTAHHIFPPHDLCEREVPGTDGCARPDAAGSRVAEYEGRPVSPSASIAAILQPAVAAAAQLKAKPLTAVLSKRLRYSENTESASNNLWTDWLRAASGADIALTNSAGYRADLPEGPLTYGRLYASMPFDNNRVLLTLTGAELRRIVTDNLKRSGSMVVFSGLRATVTCDGAELRATLRRESGPPIGDADVLRVATTDFIATGGDQFLSSVMPVHVVSTGDTMRDEVAAYLTQHGGTYPQGNDVDAPRIAFGGTRPLRCGAE